MTLTQSEFETAVSAAIAAPSVLNIQPWLFEWSGDRIDVRLDRTRRLPAHDPDDRELVISCGAALLNLRLGLGALSKDIGVTVHADPVDRDLLASVHIMGAATASDEDLILCDAIRRRRTSRVPFHDTAIPDDVRTRLVAAAVTEHALLHFSSGWSHQDLVQLIHQADSEHRFDPAIRAELDKWVGIEGDEGLPARVLGPRPKDPSSVMREFAPGIGFRRDAGDFEKTPVLAVLSTRGDEVQDWVMAGQALERVLLTATAEGLATSLNSQPIEVSSLRWLTRDTAGPISMPQAVIRLGYGPSGSASPRRPVRDVLVIREPNPGDTSSEGDAVSD